MSKQVDGPVDVAVVIGELQQHCVDFGPLPLIAIFELAVQRRHRPAVGPERLFVERVHEVRQHQRRPARRVRPEFHQPRREFDGVGLTQPAGPRVKVSRPLAFVTDRARRVVNLFDDLAQPGHCAQQRRPRDFGRPAVHVVLEFVEHFTDRFRHLKGTSIVDKAAERQRVSHVGFQLGFGLRVVTRRCRGAISSMRRTPSSRCARVMTSSRSSSVSIACTAASSAASAVPLAVSSTATRPESIAASPVATRCLQKLPSA